MVAIAAFRHETSHQFAKLFPGECQVLLKGVSHQRLKIDQPFVRQITTAPDQTTIVTAVISMGRSLKLRVVAEGVETQEELAFSRPIGAMKPRDLISAAPWSPRSSPNCSKPAYRNPSSRFAPEPSALLSSPKEGAPTLVFPFF